MFNVIKATANYSNNTTNKTTKHQNISFFRKITALFKKIIKTILDLFLPKKNSTISKPLIIKTKEDKPAPISTNFPLHNSIPNNIPPVLNKPLTTKPTNENITFPSTKELMHIYEEAKDNQDNTFNFNKAAFLNKLSLYKDIFRPKQLNYVKHLGYVEKLDLNYENHNVLFVKADIHGNLDSIMEHLNNLRNKNLLDENFKCAPNFHIILLGDFCDRGPFGLYILDLLTSLALENKDQVHLIRGNHEKTGMNKKYFKKTANKDITFKEIIKNNSQTLNEFYKSLPLSLYVSTSSSRTIKKEYIQFTHGLFEPSTDLDLLLNTKHQNKYLYISKKRKLTQRVKSLLKSNNNTLKKSAKRIQKLTNKILTNIFEEDLNSSKTLFNWARIKLKDPTKTIIGETLSEVSLSRNDILDYLKVHETSTYALKKIYRGHEHEYADFFGENDQAIVTTLPMSPLVNKEEDENEDDEDNDIAVLLSPKPHVKNWKEKEVSINLK